jgi:hypothetical protein
MTHPDPLRAGPNGRLDEPELARTAERSTSNPDAPSPERLARLADLVADRAVEFPANLDSRDEERLVGLVRQRLGARLVRFIARQIAVEIHREAEPHED